MIYDSKYFKIIIFKTRNIFIILVYSLMQIINLKLNFVYYFIETNKNNCL